MLGRLRFCGGELEDWPVVAAERPTEEATERPTEEDCMETTCKLYSGECCDTNGYE